MASYLVSGAGESDYNGVYVENGTANGHPRYQLDSTHWLAHNGTTYQLGPNSDGLGGDLYVLDGGNSNPTDGTWLELAGASPAPTVTEVSDTTATGNMFLMF